MSMKTIHVELSYAVEIEVDLPDEWTWDDIYEQALDIEPGADRATIRGREIVEATEQI